ncbi:MAG: hypothetical protein JWO32_2827, partial [Bacteroidetes bacterium]|nr:hypothetical protein [Bacteroidota bacterium]
LDVFVIRAFKPAYASKKEVVEACEKVAGDVELFLKEGSAKEIVLLSTSSHFNDPAVMKEFLQ